MLANRYPATAENSLFNSFPRISVVTPSYNQGQFLEETIRSVVLQNYPNLEFIIIDGASTDESLEIIQRYRKYLAYWVSEPDHGQSHAINKGFKRCTGEIITFLSSDDTYMPGTLMDVATRWLEAPDCGAVVGGFFFQDAKSKLLGGMVPPFLEGTAPLDLTLGITYRLHQVSTFYSRHALDTVGRYVLEDMKYVMDRELLYRVCRYYPLVLSERAYGVFRKHPESKSVSLVLPFAEEFSRLYLMNLSGNPREDRLRRRMAKRRLSGGYLKYARAVGRFGPRVSALLRALVYQPELLCQRRYAAAWRQAILRRST